ncbi:MAG TPA: threonine/serine dehydratase [Longimicrobiales bacterium]|nr:threonine/serine dehydratase [Longimicrobiales bacterium]
MIDLKSIEEARAVLGERVLRTPLLSSTTLGERTGTEAWLKAENLQKTGSFKTRGTLNKIEHLDPSERERGLVAVSAGNHAQALAYAATRAGVRSTVVMPESAPKSKVEASRGYGAEVVLHGSVFDAFDRAEELRRERDLVFVHPFEDPHIIAGQGTVGLEILEDLPEVDAVVVPAGGGGLVAGVATAIKAVRPGARVLAVEPEGAACVTAGLKAGQPVRLERVHTIADGLGSPVTGALVLEHVRARVDEVLLVSDEEIVTAMRFLLERCKLLVEPAGAAAVAAMLAGKVDVPRGAVTVAVLSGGNTDLTQLRQFLP